MDKIMLLVRVKIHIKLKSRKKQRVTKYFNYETKRSKTINIFQSALSKQLSEMNVECH